MCNRLRSFMIRLCTASLEVPAAATPPKRDFQKNFHSHARRQMKTAHRHRPAAPRLTRVAALVASSAFAAMLASQAQAQDTAAAPAPSDAASAPAGASKTDASGMQTVVVTASAIQRSKLETSLSVTTIKSDLIEALAPQSQAEVLRLIPGMIAGEGSGPGGN